MVFMNLFALDDFFSDVYYDIFHWNYLDVWRKFAFNRVFRLELVKERLMY